MAGRNDDLPDRVPLDQQMKNLLARIEQEPVSDDLKALAEELQTALRQRKRDGSQR